MENRARGIPTSRRQQRDKSQGKNREGGTRGWEKHEAKPGEVNISRRTKKVNEKDQKDGGGHWIS